jgi:biopolymer transport protein ExbD
MSFGSFSDENDVLSEMNMTPLVDVMLVLLIIFMLTMPVVQHVVKLDLPTASNQIHDLKPEHINLFLYAKNRITWDDQPITQTDLEKRLISEASKQPQPEIHLYADGKVLYEHVAQVMALVQKSGLKRMGFVTQPSKEK